MASIMDMLGDSLDAGTVAQIGQQLGVDEQTAQGAVSAAIPTIVAALARNASSPQGADALHNALGDHDGGLLDDLGGFLGGSSGGGMGGGGGLGDVLGSVLGGGGGGGLGGGLLDNIFGGRQDAVQAGLGRSTGLDGATMAKLMAMLAPIVMSALSRARSQNNLDSGGLGDLLGGESARMQQASPDGFGALTNILDANNDGSIADDVARMGGGLLGSLFGRR